MQKLILVTGPVASGKTTIARELAAHARSGGLAAAAVDMDDLVFMVNGTDWRTVNASHWALARQAAAELIDFFFASGSSVVTIAGPFFGRAEREELVRAVRSRPAVSVVVLDVQLDEAVARASTDPTRTLSKEPALLARLEATINWNELPTDAVRIRTDGQSADAVARRLFQAIIDR